MKYPLMLTPIVDEGISKTYIEYRLSKSDEPYSYIRLHPEAVSIPEPVGNRTGYKTPLYYHELVNYALTQHWTISEAELWIEQFPFKIVCQGGSYVELSYDFNRLRGLIKDDRYNIAAIPTEYDGYSRLDLYNTVKPMSIVEFLNEFNRLQSPHHSRLLLPYLTLNRVEANN